MIKHYYLPWDTETEQGYLIEQEDEGRPIWVMWEKTMRYIMGITWMLNNTLLLSLPLKDDTETEYATLADMREHLLSLPRWDKTKYFVKLSGDSDMALPVMECKTGKTIGMYTQVEICAEANNDFKLGELDRGFLRKDTK